MITFETQAAFEAAVMQAIRYRAVLNVDVECRNENVKVTTRILDEYTGNAIATGTGQDKVCIHYSDIVGTP